MGTYSKHIGTYYETISSTLLLNDAGTQSYEFTNNIVYTEFLDNTSKFIYPKSIRNAILSVYDTMPFKETSVGNSKYIGIDNGDPNNIDLKRKIYLGKRNHTDTEIMNSTLLSSNTDIFIYNTKSDSVSQDKTSIVFLASTNTILNQSAPKLQSQVAYDKNGNELIALNLLNTSGDINIISKGPNSEDSGATVSINRIVFPRVQDSDPLLGGVSDNKVLLYNNGYLVWSDLTANDTGYYGATGTTLPIYGNPTYLNDKPLEFSEDRYCPIELGDINIGDTFNNVSISEILERMIYGYLSPICKLSLYNTDKYFEVGTYPIVKLSYSITKRTNNTLPTALINQIPNSYPAITTTSTSYVTGISTGVVITPIEKDTTLFTIKVSDGTSFSSASASVSGVYPYFYGFASSNTMTTYGLSNLNKIINAKESSTIDIYKAGVSATDTFYFIYDYDYGYLNSIKDQNNNNITTYFSSSIITLSSPAGLWASKQFILYKSTLIASSYITGYAYLNNQGTIIFNFNF